MDPELVALRERYRAFMEAHVYPNEMALYAEDDAADALMAELRERARAEGLWAPPSARRRAARASASSPTPT